jgi:hypothetical protein
MRNLVLVVIGCVVVSLLGLAGVRALFPEDVLEASNDVVGNYYQTLGTVYAVLLAFVVFVVWGQFNDARSAVSEEAKDLEDLLRLASGLSEPVAANLSGKTRAYIREVVEREWDAMAAGRSHPRAAELLNDLGKDVLAVNPGTSREETVYGELLSRFNELSDARSRRLLQSQARMPGSLWALLIVGSIVTIGSMYLFGVKSFVLHGLLTGAMSGSVGFVLYLILDMDNPFEGDWRITPEPLRRLLDR